MPAVLAKGKLFATFFKYLYSTIAYANAGQKPNFRCSQTLSFTAAMGATGVKRPDQSKAKCSREPRTIIRPIQASSQRRIDLLIVIAPS